MGTRVALLLSLLLVVGLPRSVAAAGVPGTILAPADRQVALLSLEAPRPRQLTSFGPPAYVTDVAATPAGTAGSVAVSSPFGGGGPPGSDLLALDLASYATSPLVSRSDGRESLGAPAWLPDGSRLLFQREDLTATGVVYPGGSAVYYPARIEMVDANGADRTVLVWDGRQPAAAPDGTGFAFVRTAESGAALYARSLADGSERPLIAPGPFRDIAYVRYAPAGDRLAFMAPGAFVGLVMGRLAPAGGDARLHGIPWDLWVVNADGSGVRRLAELGGDDASATWSPSGTQLFVYGGAGSFLVDAASGETTPLPYVSGYGGAAWLP